MDRYKELIKYMPVDSHAFTTKKNTWEKFTEENKPLLDIFSQIFGEAQEREISRAELFEFAKEPDLKKLIIATILWGYPAGMRGNHFHHISKNLNALEKCLVEARKSINDWDTHYEKVQSIKGIGLSTYTKLLYFCGAKVQGMPCVILDQRIIDSAKKGAIVGLEELKRIAPHNASKHYPKYLEIINTAANKYDASHGNVEMFIFLFGLNTKALISPAQA